ncbi:hypothetical protein AURDEDRAFT_129176 [Auricularia subglabra TFB-10046 SS5]|uniref:Luciferase domain-containing protein n=1 Tax=Auricularia subglabra (strain TFB-10046 / SS5) TaxID=717982 RepID=J0LI02_AURST|nr:hypothetical protein AURDEDRAFT_129176 [Auricularia subglabra TFB-10046 SS5]
MPVGLDRFSAYAAQLPWQTLALISAAAGAGVVLTAQTLADFNAWSKFAYNISGKPFVYPILFIAKWITPGKSFPEKLLKSPDAAKYLREDFPERRGPYPQLPKWPFPHRHIPQLTSAAFTEALEAHVRAAAKQHNLLLAPSLREHKFSTSLYSLPASAPAPLFAHDRLHVHPDDGSTHVTLHPRDAAMVLAKGWATPFPIAGRSIAGRFGMDEGLVLVFAPRDEEEVKVVLEIIDAGVQYNLAKLPA